MKLSDIDGRTRNAALAVLALGLVVAVLLLRGAGEGTRSASTASSKATQDARSHTEVSGATTAAAPGTLAADRPAATGGAAPLRIAEDHSDEEETRPYSSDSVVVGGETADGSDEASARAAALLDDATKAVHACTARAQKVHERRGGTGRADPLWCVYDHTGMADERGPVRFDLSTRNGFSYYVDIDGKRYRYSEFDGTGCRSIDGSGSGCDAW